MVAPAAPALATITKDKEYHLALTNSDFAIPDSGLLVLLLKYLKKIRINKLSGLTFMQNFLKEEAIKTKKCLFLIDPNEKEMLSNHMFLRSKGVLLDPTDHYIAPIYTSEKVKDRELLQSLEKKRPKYILINLAGGVQEKLGLYLKNNLPYKPGIICTGAAIAFLTGKQPSIPPLFDSLHLGWLLRCLKNPRKFIPRYLKGLQLIPLILKEI